VVVSPRNEILLITLANVTFNTTLSGMPTPLTSKPKRLDKPFDNIRSLEAFTIERLNKIITEQASRIILDFPVSFEEFEGWTIGKEEIGGY
jgi:hypothetical protein